MKQINFWLTKITGYFVSILMLLIVITVLWQVFSRYVLMSPSAGSDEISRFLLIWLGLLGSTYCYQQNSHLSLDILARKLSLNAQVNLARLVHFLIFTFSLAVLIIGGINLVATTLQPVQLSAVLEIKMAYVYSVMPLTGAIYCFTAIEKLFFVKSAHFVSPQVAGE
ncbi:TRAP transporter small permease [Paraglaciecola sp. L3A3]|uniref:TRAP transporter small permease n=1 Tax=Paraglaciecola sp. L3A3 TaxID=2686358 RepID=UPI00131BED17|nr:TRAP transporter small permease [Paraglaciecola sp. L3A3]